ncbi:hypothetical protein ABUK64_13830, partial [Lactiplantibacillus argentoratensis]|uniref:hypothetical protein n=1 Tax=Lactiplantibacillus argentoratensis TaxID=271881 RepID=UPI003D265A6D
NLFGGFFQNPPAPTQGGPQKNHWGGPTFLKIRISRSNSFYHISSIFNNKITANSWGVSFAANSHSHLSLFKKDV